MFDFLTRCKHKLVYRLYTDSGFPFILCDKCLRHWNTAGIEIVPDDKAHPTWQAWRVYQEQMSKKGYSGMQPAGTREELNAPRLKPSELAPLLVEWFIWKAKPVDADAVRRYAQQEPDEFVQQLNQQLGVRVH